MMRTTLTWTAVLGLALAAPASAAPVWTAPRALSGPTVSGEDPAVASSPNGAAVVVWEQDTSSGQRIVAAVRGTGGTWGAPRALSPVRDFGASDQQVAMDARGDAVAVWLDGGRTMASQRRAGGSWSSAIRLSAPGGGTHFPQVVMSPHGTTYVVWERVMGVHERIQVVRKPVGGAWSTVRTLSGTIGDANYPQVAVDAQGAATVAWQRDWADGGRSAVIVVRRSGSGQWSSPRQVSPQRHPGNSPSVAMNARGDTVVAWEGRQSGIPTVQAVVRRAGGRWSAVGNVSHTVRASALAEVALDASGTATVAWSRWDGKNYRVVATRRTAGGHWGPAVTVSPAGEDTTWAHVAVAVGITTVTWEGTAIEGVRRPLGGTWGAVVPLSHGAAGSSHQLAVDAGGHTVVVWKHFDGSHDRVLVTSGG